MGHLGRLPEIRGGRNAAHLYSQYTTKWLLRTTELGGKKRGRRVLAGSKSSFLNLPVVLTSEGFINDLVLPATISHCIIFWGEKHYSWPNLLLVIGKKGKEKSGKVMEF